MEPQPDPEQRSPAPKQLPPDTEKLPPAGGLDSLNSMDCSCGSSTEAVFSPTSSSALVRPEERVEHDISILPKEKIGEISEEVVPVLETNEAAKARIIEEDKEKEEAEKKRKLTVTEDDGPSKRMRGAGDEI